MSGLLAGKVSRPHANMKNAGTGISAHFEREHRVILRGGGDF
jgi:hypothetical protein